MNQVTTRVLSSGATLVPALGESWSHACTNRLMLCREADQRVAKLLKSTSRRMGTASYAITTDGVRDVTAKRKDRPQGSHLEAKDSEDDLTPPAKGVCVCVRAHRGSGVLARLMRVCIGRQHHVHHHMVKACAPFLHKLARTRVEIPQVAP